MQIKADTDALKRGQERLLITYQPDSPHVLGRSTSSIGASNPGSNQNTPRLPDKNPFKDNHPYNGHGVPTANSGIGQHGVSR